MLDVIESSAQFASGLFNLSGAMRCGLQLAGQLVFSLSLLPKTTFKIQLLLVQMFAYGFRLPALLFDMILLLVQNLNVFIEC